MNKGDSPRVGTAAAKWSVPPPKRSAPPEPATARTVYRRIDRLDLPEPTPPSPPQVIYVPGPIRREVRYVRGPAYLAGLDAEHSIIPILGVMVAIGVAIMIYVVTGFHDDTHTTTPATPTTVNCAPFCAPGQR